MIFTFKMLFAVHWYKITDFEQTILCNVFEIK